MGALPDFQGRQFQGSSCVPVGPGGVPVGVGSGNVGVFGPAARGHDVAGVRLDLRGSQPLELARVPGVHVNVPAVFSVEAIFDSVI